MNLLNLIVFKFVRITVLAYLGYNYYHKFIVLELEFVFLCLVKNIFWTVFSLILIEITPPFFLLR